MNRIFFLLKTGLKNVLSHRGSNINLIISMFVLITVNLTLLTVRNNISGIVHIFREQASLELILEKGVKADAMKPLIERISSGEVIDALSITYKDETRNLKEFMESDPDIALAVEMLEDNPLPPTISVKLNLSQKTLDNIARLAADAQEMKEVSRVIYPERWLSILNRGLAFTRDALVVIIAALLLISWFLWISIFKSTIYNVRDEVEIMEVVGGTSLYIRAPFYIETVICTAVSYLLSLGLISQAFSRITHYIPGLIFLSKTQILTSAGFVILLTLLGTEKAINRILK